MKRWFITGTDTEIGKTYASCALIHHLVSQGYEVAAMKPVASGCEMTDEGLRNEDAIQLMTASNVEQAYKQVNPFAYEPPIAPHLAAEAVNKPIDIGQIAATAQNIYADYLIIEGVGGWCVPLGKEQILSDMVKRIADGVILVVGMRLGCINHALLTAAQIQREGIPLLGWISNQLDPDMDQYENNLDTLKLRLPVPLLGNVLWSPTGTLKPNAQWTISMR